MPRDEHNAIDRLAAMLRNAEHAVAFTGAGISTESGIPDFRSPGGVWSKNTPVLYQNFLADPAERRRYWRMRTESMQTMLYAQPNAGHEVLARLEDDGRIVALITQNIDELHQRAGSRRVLELHGTAMTVSCLSCDKRWPAAVIQERVAEGDEEPVCDECSGILKSMTISFGQAMPEDVMRDAKSLAQDCDLFVAIGSSLVVQPAAALPAIARTCGARLVIINRDPTPLDDMADIVIRAPIGATLSAVVERLGE